MNLPIGTSGTNEIQYMKYTSEYIPKLQIHQHSLLTRKVFSWHNSSTQVFLSILSRSSLSSHHLHLQVIFIFKLSSSRSGSSLDLDHHWCYLMILLVTRSSTEPALFHVVCKPSLHVGIFPALISDLLVRKAHPALTSDHVVNYNHIRKAQHLYLSTWEHIPQSHQKGSALISEYVGTHPSVTSERLLHLHLSTWEHIP